MNPTWSIVIYALLVSSASTLNVTNKFTSAIDKTFGSVRSQAPVVTLDYGKFQGFTDALSGVTNYLGIPFASAPRFDHAYFINESLPGIQDATQYGNACPQQELVSEFAPSDLGLGAFAAAVELALIPSLLRQSEDCLNINVQLPANTEPGAGLPVLMWIHGGAYSDGAAAAFAAEETATPGIFYQTGKIVQRSIEMNKPIIGVSANYRLNAFGLSGGKEMEDGGVTNLWLEDQRLAMKWIQKNIEKFGGDPQKVTIMGESAGSWSVSNQLVAYDGDNENLFRAAIAQSGGPMKVDNQARAQGAFDSMCEFVGCGQSEDKLGCLRKAPYSKLYESVQTQPLALGFRSLALSWAPRPDGRIFKSSPDQLAKEGKIAKVPVMIGDMTDEGTLFSIITQLNITTDSQFKEYFQTFWWPKATDAQLERLMELYPANSAAGSPFGTGYANELLPQYKRLAALIGDYSFESQRRRLIENIPADQPVYTYQTDTSLPLLGDIPLLNELGLSAIPVLGSFHVSDALLYTFGTIPPQISANTRNIMGTIISFVNTMDPNDHDLGIPEWPRYNTNSKMMYHFQEAGPDIIHDTYRQEAMDYINEIADSLEI